MYFFYNKLGASSLFCNFLHLVLYSSSSSWLEKLVMGMFKLIIAKKQLIIIIRVYYNFFLLNYNDFLMIDSRIMERRGRNFSVFSDLQIPSLKKLIRLSLYDFQDWERNFPASNLCQNLTILQAPPKSTSFFNFYPIHEYFSFCSRTLVSNLCSAEPLRPRQENKIIKN